MSENGKMRSMARLLTETQSGANGPLSGKKRASLDVSERGGGRNTQSAAENSGTDAWGRLGGENNMTEESFPQHHRLTNQAL